MKKSIKKILIPLPSYGFDPTEAAIPWKLLTQNNFQVIFATPQGRRAQGDIRMLTGEGLGLFKRLLMARKDAIETYTEMSESEEFVNPIKYDEIVPEDYKGIFLPGGHDKRVKEYLESRILQSIIPYFFHAHKKIAAVCHGPLLLARSIDPQTNKSVLYNYKTTSLLKSQELLAYNLTRLWLKDYYLTYPGRTVEEQVISALKNSNQFIRGPLPMFRDSPKNLKYGFSLRDRNYISARWPGDIYNLSLNFIKMLNEDVH